jgi:putative phage-type endonuclease
MIDRNYNVLLDEINVNTDAWKDAKKGKIGGSQIATIIGLNPYQSPLELWAEFTGRKAPAEENAYMRQGKRMEPIIAEMFKERFPEVNVRPVNQLWQSKDNDRFIATPDYGIYSEDFDQDLLGLAEFKLSRVKGLWGESEAPNAAILQLHWQLGIGGIRKGWVCGLTGIYDDSFYTPQFPFSQEVYDSCRIEAEKFLEDVEKDNPPSARAGDDKLIKNLVPDDASGIATLDKDKEAIEWFQLHENAAIRRADLKRQLKTVEDKMGIYETELVKKIYGCSGGIAGRYRIDVRKSPRAGYTVAASIRTETKISYKSKDDEE